MPREIANPDPLISEHTRARDGKTFVVHAYRRGAYVVYLDGKVVDTGSDQLQGFAGGRKPTNKRQADVMAVAKGVIDRRPVGMDW